MSFLLQRGSMILVTLLCFTGCKTAAKPVATAHGLQPSDLLWEPNEKSLPATIARADLNADLGLLLYALEKGYGGRAYHPPKLFGGVLGALRNFRAADDSVPIGRACEEIAEILGRLADSHLVVKRSWDGRRCGAPWRTSQVGPNVGERSPGVWGQLERWTGDRRIPVFFIKRFPPPSSEVWKGFLEAVAGAMPSAPALIFDLRGNSGGDDAMGRELARLLYGQEFPTPVREIVRSQTPESKALMSNTLTLFKKLATAPEEARAYEDERRHLLADSESSEQRIVPKETGPIDESKIFPKPVVFLTDAGCGSSCENTLQFFEKHPSVVTIGENTAGIVHFGQTGRVILPRTGLLIQLATQAVVFKDGRKVEGKGYAPKVSVPAETDALDRALLYLERKTR